MLVGAGLGLTWPGIPSQMIGAVMAFGAGVLISAVVFDLVEGGFEAAGA